LSTDNFSAQREQRSRSARPAGVGSRAPTDRGSESGELPTTACVARALEHRLDLQTTEQLGGKSAFRANLAVLRTDDEMTRSLWTSKA